MTQRYTDQTAIERLREGSCPECGRTPEAHTGLGGPNGCTLTDNGVAGRIHAQRQADAAQAHRAVPNSAETILADVLTEIAIADLPDEDVPAALLEGLNSRGWTLTNWNSDADEQVDLSLQFVRVNAAHPIPGVIARSLGLRPARNGPARNPAHDFQPGSAMITPPDPDRGHRFGDDGICGLCGVRATGENDSCPRARPNVLNAPMPIDVHFPPGAPTEPDLLPQPLLGTESSVFSAQSWDLHKTCLPYQCVHRTPGYCPRVQRERLHTEAIKMDRRWEYVHDQIEDATWD